TLAGNICGGTSAEWRRFNQSGGATLTPANKKRYTGAALSP
ncbi:hypothetical protein LTSEBAI_3375, partial [Salmonella enterica subsp. enterica serovar Baildon str. R6-199]